ncbi:MAG: hypothetical protein HQ582_19305 [Planctomycetes bacterium]|nr:hypothetical protein [Planctomycetota bacterium]
MTSKVPDPFGKPLEELSEANRPWWRRYSHHGEFPWSTVVSCVLHLFILLLIAAATAPLLKYDRTPPSVDVVYAGEDTPAPGNADDLPGGSLEEGAAEEVTEEVPDEMTETEVDEVTEPKPLDPQVNPLAPSLELAPLEEQMKEAQERLNRAQEQLRKNQDGSGGGSSGPGRGGSGGSGRGARASRWVLKFNTRATQDYLAQLDGLGASIAFPQSGNEFLYIYNPSSSNPRQERRSLAGENRINWVDRDRETVTAVCSALKVSVAPFMLAFLPVEMEERLLRLELAYNNLEEDEILSTTFEVVHRGGKYDAIVASQRAR